MSYSSAYYRVPDHLKMAQKEWLGADLIFDLDADHLREAAGLSDQGQLELVKRKVRSLLEEFLLGDFGISPENAQLYLSGGRGYRVHVRDEAFLPLNSPERRELVVRDGFRLRRHDGRGSAQGSGPGADRRLGGRGGGLPRAPTRRQPGCRSTSTPPTRPAGGAGRPEGFSRCWHGGTFRPLGRPRRARGGGRLPVGGPTVRPQALGRREGPNPGDALPRRLQRGGSRGPPRPGPPTGGHRGARRSGRSGHDRHPPIHPAPRLPAQQNGLRVTPLSLEELAAFDPLRDATLPAPSGEAVEVVLAEDVDHEVAQGLERTGPPGTA